MNARPILALLPALLALATMVPAHAQTVYRCGNAYSQSPCPGGKEVKVADPRTPAEKAKADKDTEDANKTAAQLQRERKAEEDGVLPEKRHAPRKKAPAKPSADAGSSQDKSQRLFTALVPADKDTPRKAGAKTRKAAPDES